MMREAGFLEVRTTEVQRTRLEFPARSALEARLLDRSTVSQLAILSDAEYDRGLRLLLEDIERFEARGESLNLVVDLRFYATVGWRPEAGRR
jgi:hypothetical protein